MMTSMRDVFISRIRTSLHDPSDLEDADYDQALAQALVRHSMYRPREVVADIQGNGSYDLTLPSTFVNGFSTIISVEYPVGQQTPNYLYSKDYTIYRTATATKLRLLNYSPSTSEIVRVIFTAMHTITDTSTLPPSDEWAVVNLAAHFSALILSAFYRQHDEPTNTADVMDWRTKGDLWANVARDHYKLWANHIGMRENDLSPAYNVNFDIDLSFQWQRDFIIHSKTRR